MTVSTPVETPPVPETKVPSEGKGPLSRWLRIAFHPALGFAVLTVAVSLAFFIEGLNSDYTALSGDQINILTMCAKLDHPDLLQGDLIVGDVRNTEYYTPWFLMVVRVLSLPDHNYIRGLSWLLLLTSLVYMWGWWALFSIWGDRWLAAVLAFLVRGIMWPPGYEIWGIASLWSMVPRTLFLALLPWVLLGWLKGRDNPRLWGLSCLGCGLLANVHPISGACFAVALCLAELARTWTATNDWRKTAGRFMGAGILMFIGMVPFIWTYVSKLGSAEGVDPVELDQALRIRLQSYFFDPLEYLGLWLRPKWFVVVFVPWILFLIVVWRERAKHKPLLLAMLAFSAGCLLVGFVPFAVEAYLKSKGHQVNFAFQLVRNCKYLIVPSILLGSGALILGARRLVQDSNPRRLIVIALASSVFVLPFLTRHSSFDRVPFLGDDVVRSLWPGHVCAELSASRRTENFHEVLNWIRAHTPESARFVGPREIRPVALRSVVHDWAAAVVLIEGNPKAYVEAGRREQQFRQLRDSDPTKLPGLVASWSADYLVTKIDITNAPIAFHNQHWRVYDVRSFR